MKLHKIKSLFMHSSQQNERSAYKMKENIYKHRSDKYVITKCARYARKADSPVPKEKRANIPTLKYINALTRHFFWRRHIYMCPAGI